MKRILGIETSCDDTCIAIIETKGTTAPSFSILSNIVSSQTELNKKYGGVYPNEAKREHQKNLPVVLAQALKKAGAGTIPAIDAIAVTYGPGLSPCLWTGITFAQNLAKKWNIPLIPINHMEGHLLIALCAQSNKNDQTPITNVKMPSPILKINKILHAKYFPAIALLVSGGHTQLVLVEGIGKYKIIGETRDDAAGEAFDKTARILGLGYPGGPAIAAAAAQVQSSNIKYQNENSALQTKLPRPMIHTKDFDFSFSGLKTAVLYNYQSQSAKIQKSKEYIQEMAKKIQSAIVDVLISKTLRATYHYGAQTIILGGGVAANTELRKQFQYKMQDARCKMQILAPPKNLCTDNGVMPAIAGYFAFISKNFPQNPASIEAKPNLRLE